MAEPSSPSLRVATSSSPVMMFLAKADDNLPIKPVEERKLDEGNTEGKNVEGATETKKEDNTEQMRVEKIQQEKIEPPQGVQSPTMQMNLDKEKTPSEMGGLPNMNENQVLNASASAQQAEETESPVF